MHQNTAPTCPAPSTTSAELLTALSQGSPIAMAPGSAPSPTALHAVADELRSGDASGIPLAPGVRCEYCRQVGNGCSLARCRNPAPRRAAQAATPAPAAPDNRRVVVMPCTCEGHYRGTLKAPAVRVPALRLRGTPDADVIDAYAAVSCHYWSHDTMGELDDAALEVSVASRQVVDQLEELVLQPRGIRVSIEHITLT